MSKAALLFPALLLAAPVAAEPAAAQDGNVAVRAGKVITAPGQVIENGTVVVQNGRIVAVGGPDLEVPFDTMLREYPDGVLFAGFTEAHTSDGLDRPNENVPVAPFLNVADSIDPVSFYFEDELRGGTTAIGVIPGNNCVIGGRGAVVAPTGRTVEEMALSSAMGMKIAIGPKWGWSRSTQLAELREAESKLNDSLRRLGQRLLDQEADQADAVKAGEDAPEKKEDEDDLDSAGGFIQFGDDFPGKALISEEDLNDPDRGLADILNGSDRIWLACPDATDVMHGIRWVKEHGLLDQTVFVVEAGAHKAASMLAETGRPVALTGGLFHIEIDLVTRKEERTFAPKVFADAGVTLTIGSEKGRMGPDRLAYQAATCVREGVAKDAALAMVSSNAGTLWGMEGKIGVLAEGAIGNMVILSGDPLSLQSKVIKVWVAGNEAYDRANDVRLQRLLEGAEQ
ncbi:MAG: amidohydrolase family protein [Planctomycetes bacterium]|nr:amidohydrolase family protein [Planctomycetota bacterium]